MRRDRTPRVNALRDVLRGAFLRIGIGLVIGPLVAYCTNIVLYGLGFVSHLALRQWEEALQIGWCIAVPAGALIGGFRLGYRASLLSGALSSLLFAYSLFGLYYWQGQGKLPYYPDFSWMLIVLTEGIVIALLVRWISGKIWKDMSEPLRLTYDAAVAWLSGGTSLVLLLLWWFIGHTAATPERPKAAARFTSVEILPSPARLGEMVTIRVGVEAEELVKSVYIIDPLHGAHILHQQPQSPGQRQYSFIGRLRVEGDTGAQRFIAVAVTPSGRAGQEVTLHILPKESVQQR